MPIFSELFDKNSTIIKVYTKVLHMNKSNIEPDFYKNGQSSASLKWNFTIFKKILKLFKIKSNII